MAFLFPGGPAPDPAPAPATHTHSPNRRYVHASSLSLSEASCKLTSSLESGQRAVSRGGWPVCTFGRDHGPKASRSILTTGGQPSNSKATQLSGTWEARHGARPVPVPTLGPPYMRVSRTALGLERTRNLPHGTNELREQGSGQHTATREFSKILQIHRSRNSVIGIRSGVDAIHVKEGADELSSTF